MNTTNKFLALAVAALVGCTSQASQPSGQGQTPDSLPTQEAVETEQPASRETAAKPEDSSIPAGARALMRAYPGKIKGFENNQLIFADGSRLTYDDGRKKTFVETLDEADPQDMFELTYVIPDGSPEYLHDVGRSRSEALYKKMYGNSSGAVQSNLVSVPWFGQNVKFTRVNGAADSLRKVAAELARHPELKPYLKSSGTFYWRPVRGAKRLSAHSYGIAFDIGAGHNDYWLWKNPGASETAKIKYVNRMPKKIAEIFQKHGFIWGGSWYHFDTMHFEFRPELLIYAQESK